MLENVSKLIMIVFLFVFDWLIIWLIVNFLYRVLLNEEILEFFLLFD